MISMLGTDSVMDLGESSNRGEILGGEFQDVLEFGACFLKPADFNQRPPERHVSGKV